MHRTKDEIISEIRDLLRNMAVGYVLRRAGKPELLDNRLDALDHVHKTFGIFCTGYDLLPEDGAKLIFRFGAEISEELELGQYNYDPYFDVIIYPTGGAKLSSLLQPGADIKSHIKRTRIAPGTYDKLIAKDEAALEEILGNLDSRLTLLVAAADFN